MTMLAALAQMDFDASSGRLWSTVLLIVLWLVVIAGLVYLVVRILNARSPGLAERREGMSTVDIVKARFERGEIDRDLYRSLLEGSDETRTDDEDDEEDQDEDEDNGDEGEDDVDVGFDDEDDREDGDSRSGRRR